MNKQLSLSEDDPSTAELMAELDTYSSDKLKSLLIEERQRCLVMEKDLFKA